MKYEPHITTRDKIRRIRPVSTSLPKKLLKKDIAKANKVASLKYFILAIDYIHTKLAWKFIMVMDIHSGN